jgi:hypothetical protein
MGDHFMISRKLSVILAAAASGLLLSSAAFAVPNYQSPGIWNEGPYFNSFGGPLPPGIVEGSAGFSTIGDYDGRVIANAGVTTDTADGSPLTTINTGLFSGTDVNLYEIAITNPAAFTASVPNTTAMLALFNSTGTALAASIGGTADALNSSNDGVTAPGIYYIALADAASAGLFPSNNAGGLLFGAPAVAGVYAPVSLADMTLSTNANQAWASSTGAPTSPLLTNTSFSAPSSTITLTGAGFAVVPEPTTLGILAAGSLGLLARRRKRA